MIDDVHQGAFGSCTFQEFKEHVSSFFKQARTATREQIDNGFKALSIFYFSLETEDELELHQAQLLLDMAGRK